MRQHPHFLFTRFRIIDLNRRESSGEKCSIVSQDTVQHDKNIMHSLRSKLIIEKQFLGEVANQAVRHAHEETAAQASA